MIDNLDPEIFNDDEMAEMKAEDMPSEELAPLTPTLIRQYEDHCKRLFNPYRWRRMVLRLMDQVAWRWRGLLLWLVRHSFLRYLPFPYPAIANVKDWMLQADAMTHGQALSCRHLKRAQFNGAFTATNLGIMTRFRDRVGWETAFLEDGVVQGLLISRSRRGQAQRIKAAAIQESKDRMSREMTDKERLQAARALIGPRGGLPALKDDLTRLALLLHLPVNPKDTVATLQDRIRPSVEMLKQVAPAKAAPTTPKPKAMTPPATLSPPAESTTSSWSRPTATMADEQLAHVVALGQQLQQQMNDQEGRFNVMMQQVMEAVQHGPLLPPALPEVDAEMVENEGNNRL